MSVQIKYSILKILWNIYVNKGWIESVVQNLPW